MVFKTTEKLTSLKLKEKGKEIKVYEKSKTPEKTTNTIVALEKSINMLIKTITANSKNEIKFRPVEHQFESSNDMSSVSIHPTVNQSNCVTLSAYQKNFNVSENQCPNHNNQFVTEPNIGLNPSDYLYTKNKSEDVQAVNFDDISEFIKQRQQYLTSERNESDFSFKITGHNCVNIEDGLNENYLAQNEQTSEKKSQIETFQNEESPENIFVNVLGKTIKNNNDSVIAIIDEKFEIDN